MLPTHFLASTVEVVVYRLAINTAPLLFGVWAFRTAKPFLSWIDINECQGRIFMLVSRHKSGRNYRAKWYMIVLRTRKNLSRKKFLILM
jgi:hypothetical protein